MYPTYLDIRISNIHVTLLDILRPTSMVTIHVSYYAYDIIYFLCTAVIIITCTTISGKVYVQVQATINVGTPACYIQRVVHVIKGTSTGGACNL